MFSAEHPVFTAYGTQDWYYDDDGKILHFPVDNYYYEGKREAVFLGEKVIKYHRTLTTYINSLIEAGFSIQHVIEPQPPAAMMELPGMPDEMRRPMMLLVSAKKETVRGDSMIRKAAMEDIEAVVRIYDAILTEEEEGRVTIGWQRGVYLTENTALEALRAGTLFVLEEDGMIRAAAKIDQNQVPCYAQCSWNNMAPDDQVMVLHTLVVDPAVSGRGYGTEFVRFYESYAAKSGCAYLRMDTNQRNSAARSLYKKLGYTEAGIVPCEFNGIAGVNLVCLEKKL